MAIHSAFPTVKPYRIAIAGDWHGDLDHALRVLLWAHERGAEGILQLGDFGIWPGGVGRDYIRVLNRELARRGMWLAFIDGNHENFDLLESKLLRRGVRPVTPRITHLPRGHRWMWGEATWLALGGAVSMDAHRRTPLVDWWPQEEITAGQALRAAQDGHAEYMLTHDCPAGVDVPGLLEDIWSQAALRAANQHREQLRAVLEAVQPNMLFHGHMHVRYTQRVQYSPGTVTKIFGLNDNHGPFEENLLLVDLDRRGFVLPPAS